jgi:hypothetical protein
VEARPKGKKARERVGKKITGVDELRNQREQEMKK